MIEKIIILFIIGMIGIIIAQYAAIQKINQIRVEESEMCKTVVEYLQDK